MLPAPEVTGRSCSHLSRYVKSAIALGWNAKAEALLYAASLAILLFSIHFRSPAALTYDERNFYPNLELLQKTRLDTTFLRSMKYQSPGPLYQVVHLAASPITRLSIKRMRFLNLLMLVAAIVVLGALLSEKLGMRGWFAAGSLLAIPVTWVIGGLALTEAPSLLFLMLCLLLLQSGLSEKISLAGSLLLAILAGACMSCAIAGRTPYLLVIPAAWALYKPNGKSGVVLVAFTATSLIVPALLFYTWQGLVPPHVAQIHGALEPLYVFWGLAYAGAFIFLIAPSCLTWNPGWALLCAILGILFAAFNFVFQYRWYLPMTTAIRGALGEEWSRPAGYIFPGLIAVAGLYCALCLGVKAWRGREGRDNQLFGTLAAVAIIVTCAKSSAQFSSRYVLQAAPFLILAAGEYAASGPWRLARLSGGITLGLISLMSYYV